MKSIWKFQLDTTDLQQVEMPKNSKIISLQIQHDNLCIWAEVDTEAEKETRTFEVFGTGHPMPEATREFIGTYQLRGGIYVFHLFERKLSPNLN